LLFHCEGFFLLPYLFTAGFRNILSPSGECAQILLHIRCIVKSAFPDQRGSAQPEAQVFFSFPVSQIVTAFIPVLRIVGDLISVIPILLKQDSCSFIDSPVFVFIRKRRPCRPVPLCPLSALPVVLEKRSSFFYNKTVCGNMLRSQLCDSPKRFLPVFLRLSRNR